VKCWVYQGGVRFSGAKIDVGAQRLQRQPTLQVPLFAGDFRAVQAAATRTLMPLQPKRARSRPPAIARRKATRFSSCSAIDSATRVASSSGRCTSWMSICTSRLVRFCTSCFSLSISEPLRDDDTGARGVNAHHQLVGRALNVY